MTADHADDIVRLVTAPNPVAAHIWEQALRAEGICCRVVGDYLDAGIGDVPGLTAEIWVHRDDVARAEAVLRQAQQRASEERDQGTSEKEAEEQ